MTPTATRLFTVDEYYRMAQHGILKPDERTELIEGQIIQMAAQNPPHSAITNRIGAYFRELFAHVATIRSQSPIQLKNNSMPEPDIAVVKIDARDYFDRHPLAEEVFLLIEVSDSTLYYDLNDKLMLYARNGVNEYWVVDVNEEVVHAFSRPLKGQYLEKRILRRENGIHPIMFKDIDIDLSRFFP